MLTYRDLALMAQSRDPAERRRCFKAFRAWVGSASSLEPQQRLTPMECDGLSKLFAQKRLGGEQATTALDVSRDVLWEHRREAAKSQRLVTTTMRRRRASSLTS